MICVGGSTFGINIIEVCFPNITVPTDQCNLIYFPVYYNQ